MTEIKRYEMEKEYSLDINVIPVEEHDGSFVSYDDHAAIVAAKDARIAALQEQVRALAAENAAVKSYLNDGGIGIEISMGETHAFIREIRAQGAIDARNALVVAGDGADIYAVVTDVAARIRAGEQP